MSRRVLSIKAIILLLFLWGFVALLISTTVWSFWSQRTTFNQYVEQRAEEVASLYFDGLNTLMLTGTMAQRETLRNKVLGRHDLVDLRVVRGEAIKKIYGPGLDHEQPMDGLDQDGLKGIDRVQFSEFQGDRRLTRIIPFVARADYHGTNCQTCHAVPEGTVLGAIRVTYSLASWDRAVFNNTLGTTLINALLFGLGIVFLLMVFNHLVLRRLRQMRDTMNHIEGQSDLTHRLNAGREDEIGLVGKAFNSMLERFSSGLQEVANTTAQLSRSAGQVAELSELSSSNATEQRERTEVMVTAIAELDSTMQQLADNTSSSLDAAKSADQATRTGASLAGDVLQAIDGMAQQLDSTSRVIEELNLRSRDVMGVLGVIKGISEQTNLLALNAAIEAARAGEMGRGFAVVAAEVRSLATKSHASAQEIDQIVTQLQDGVNRAIQAMRSTRDNAEVTSRQVVLAAEQLRTIAAQVAHINALTGQTATSVEAQRCVAQEVNGNVVKIRSSADSTAEHAGQTSTISEDLVTLVSKLEGMLRLYRLKKS